ncbi:TM2 domain-containing protein (plasmid) [Paraburkholderia sp. PREW-6R]|uniref:TM2 domain-containing protein n=1 Tax=Paraburkholderia sp. PREW-6R TaxID=3141544 RepID=UPI0031F5157D
MSDVSRQMMMYDAQKKSIVLAFLLWFFLGYLGAHRFYAGKTVTAIVQLMLSLIGGGLAFAGVGFVFIGLVGIWLFVDLFLLPGMIRRYNLSLAGRLG